jgi:hypothetical protein
MRNRLPLLLAVLTLAFAAATGRADDDEAPPPANAEAAPEAPAAPSLYDQRHRKTPAPRQAAPASVDGGEASPAAPPAAPDAAPAPAAAPASGGAPPSGDNPAAALGDKANYVNGIMFVGWSPQDHPNGGTGTPKYDAYNYLVNHKVDPNDKTWAPAAAAGLNKQYPCKFWAQDGETLIYEDEYIHSAPPGHGAPGGAIPGAKGEFIWGGMNGYVPPGNPCGGPSGQVHPAAGGGGAGHAPAPAPAGSGPVDHSTRYLYNKGDALDLRDARILNNPPDLAAWPVTTEITTLEIRPTGIHVEFSKREGPGRWPDITPPGWKGPLQYTLGMALFIDGHWYASAPIQLWHGLDESGGEPGGYARNWFYDTTRWGPMSGHQPVAGEKIGIFVVAGNVRNLTDGGSQSPVKERSNVVVVPMPKSGGAVYNFK